MRVPGGGRLLTGRPGFGALPSTTARPFRPAAGAHYPLAVGAGGADVGTRHQPHSARSCELALRAVGAAQGRPGGGTSCLGVGRLGSGALPPPTARPLRACGRCPLPTGCGCGVCGRGDPSSTPQRALLRGGLARCGGGTRAPRAARLLPGCGAPGVGRSPTPDLSSFQACSRGPLPTRCGCGGAGRGDPSPTPQRALLRAGFARCGGSTRARGGGASCLGVGRPGSGALPLPTTLPFRRAAGAHYPLAVGAGDAGVGSHHQPQRALLRAGFARCGCGMWVPGGGASCLGVGRPGSGALPPPTARLFGRAAGAHYPLAVGAGGADVGTRHGPHSARSCELALRAVGAACGCPGGAPLAWVWGVRGWALSYPRPLVFSGVRPGPTTHWLWVRGVRACRSVTNPTARAPASWLCVLWGRLLGARGGRLLLACGASGVGRSPTPDRSSFGACSRGPLPTGCGCGGCGRGDLSPTPQRALLRAGFARCGGGTRAPRGAPLAWVCGVRGRALSHP